MPTFRGSSSLGWSGTEIYFMADIGADLSTVIFFHDSGCWCFNRFCHCSPSLFGPRCTCSAHLLVQYLG